MTYTENAMLCSWYKQVRESAFKDVIKALEDEKVDAAATGEPTDLSYNQALDDAIEAIKALT